MPMPLDAPHTLGNAQQLAVRKNLASQYRLSQRDFDSRFGVYGSRPYSLDTGKADYWLHSVVDTGMYENGRPQQIGFIETKMRYPWACIALSVSACSFLPASVSDNRPAAPVVAIRSASPTGILAKTEECPTQANRQPHESPFVGIGAEDCCDARGTKGVYVVKLYKNSPAGNSKLRIADRIFQFGGCRIEAVGQLANAIANATVRASVMIHFVRDVRADSVTVFTRSASPDSSHWGSIRRSDAEKERVCREAGLRPAC